MAMNPRLLRPSANDSPASIPGLALWLDASASGSLYTTDAGPVSAVSSPLDISGCALWLDASDSETVTLVGGLVDSVSDKSGNGRHMSYAGARPNYLPDGIGGLPAVQGTGTQYLIAGSANIAAESVTLVAVYQLDEWQTGVSPLNKNRNLLHTDFPASGSTNFGYRWENGANSASGRVGDADSSGPFTSGHPVASLAPQVHSFRFERSTLAALTRTGGLNAYSSAWAAANTPATFGSRVSLMAGFSTETERLFVGRVGEFVFFSRALSDAELASVEAYLAAKWGISGVHAPAVSASDPVGYWRDRSGNGRHATQSTAASRPVVGTSSTSGKNAVRNSGSGSVALQVAAWPYVAGNTQFAVFNASAINQAIYQRGSLNDEPRMAIQVGANGAAALRATRGGTLEAQTHSDVGYALSQWSIGATLFNTSLGRVCREGVYGADTTDSQTFTGNQGLRLLSLPGNIYGINGGIAEFLNYDRQLNANEVTKVARYLARKWGITLAPQVSNAEAQDWVNRVYAAGSTVSQPVANAVSDFITGCQSDGIWDAMKSVVLLAGADTLAGALAPMKGTAPTSYNFASGDYNKTSGLKGNGNSTYLDTNRSNTTDPQDSKHLAVFVTDDSTDASAVRGLIYAGDNGTAGSSGIGYRNSDGISLFQANNASAHVPTIASLAGLAGVSRSSSTGFVARHSGSNVSVTAASDSPAAGNLFAYRRNASNYSSARLSFYSIGESLDLALLDARVSALMTAIGVS